MQKMNWQNVVGDSDQRPHWAVEHGRSFRYVYIYMYWCVCVCVRQCCLPCLSSTIASPCVRARVYVCACVCNCGQCIGTGTAATRSLMGSLAGQRRRAMCAIKRLYRETLAYLRWTWTCMHALLSRSPLPFCPTTPLRVCDARIQRQQLKLKLKHVTVIKRVGHARLPVTH